MLAQIALIAVVVSGILLMVVLGLWAILSDSIFLD